MSGMESGSTDGGSSCSAPFPHTFQYVKIPADVDQPFEQLEAVATALGDQMSQAVCKAHFACGSVKNASGLAAEFGTDILSERLGALNRAAAAGSVEVFALVRPSSSTRPVPHAGTYIYLDEMGVLKDLPVNKRASEIAKGCGLDVESPFHGDVYIGRTRVQPSPARNETFHLSELHSGSEFYASAPSENEQYRAAMEGFTRAAKEKQVLAPIGPRAKLDQPQRNRFGRARRSP